MQWDPAYDLGIEDIDLQHHFFLNLVNRLANELQAAQDDDRRLALIEELNAYTRFHFISEENLMRREGFAQADEHRQHHRALLDQLSHRQASLAMKHTAESAEAMVLFLREWFLNHTQHEDRRFAQYMASHAQRAGQ